MSGMYFLADSNVIAGGKLNERCSVVDIRCDSIAESRSWCTFAAYHPIWPVFFAWRAGVQMHGRRLICQGYVSEFPVVNDWYRNSKYCGIACAKKGKASYGNWVLTAKVERPLLTDSCLLQVVYHITLGAVGLLSPWPAWLIQWFWVRNSLQAPAT